MQLFFQGCGKTLQENNGVFGYTPEPGQEYGERCEWRITATHGERIVLNITELDLLKSDHCNTDYLEIRDGYWHKSPLLGKYNIFSKNHDFSQSAEKYLLYLLL